MEEKIYTIPVTEAFSAEEGCPFCRLYRNLEETERDLVMGASMMEPDVRIKTNEKGFCRRHYGMMLEKGNRLSLALMLESHLACQREKTAIHKKALFGEKDASVKAAEAIRALSESCYICERVEEKFSKMLATAVYLWEKEPSFRELTGKQPYFCLPHTARLLGAAAKLDKKSYAALTETLHTVQEAYETSLAEDVSWFCKKFDYRYENEPWGNAKNAPERAIAFLCSGQPEEK